MKSVIAWQLRGHVSFPGLQVMGREARVPARRSERWNMFSGGYRARPWR